MGSGVRGVGNRVIGWGSEWGARDRRMGMKGGGGEKRKGGRENREGRRRMRESSEEGEWGRKWKGRIGRGREGRTEENERE